MSTSAENVRSDPENVQITPDGQMSADEAKMWEEAAQELQPPKMLTRAREHQNAVISTVTTVGTLLAGLGGVTAAITVNSATTYWNGIPVVPVMTLAVSVLAGCAVLAALVAKRPTFQTLNTHNVIEVEEYVVAEIERSRSQLRLSSTLLLLAAGLAVVVALIAGIQALRADGPRNLASISASVGEKGSVQVSLSGAVDRLSSGQYVHVQVESDVEGGPLIDLTVYPDAEGKAALSATAQAPPLSSAVSGSIRVLDAEREEVRKYDLEAVHAPVPVAPTATPSQTPTAS